MVGMSNENYESLGLTKGASRASVKKAYMRLHPNKGGNTAGFQSRRNAYERIMRSLDIMAAAEARNKAKNNGRRTNVSGAVGSAVAHNVNEFFRRKNVVAIVPRKGNQPAVGLKPATNNSNPMAIVPFKNKPHEVVPIPAKIEKNIPAPPGPATRPVSVNTPPGVAPRRSFLNFFKGVGRPSAREAVMTKQNALPPRRSLMNRFGGLFGPRAPAPVNWERVAKQERNVLTVNAIKKGNFIRSGRFKGAKPGYKFTLGKHGQGYYRNTVEYGPEGPPSVNTKNMGTGTNKGPKNMGTGNGNKGTGNGGGSTRVRTGNVRTGATRIGNVKSTSGSSRVEGVRGGSSQSEGGRGGTGGSISFAPVIKVNVPQAAAQSAVQALPAQERLALTNAGGYNNAAAAVSSAGGPATVERAIAALNANGGNVNAAMQKTGLPRQVFNNVNKLGGPVTARRTLMAVKKVTVKTAPYVRQNATRRVAPNVYALAPMPVKKHRKKRMEVKLSELNRVINAVKKKKLTSLVAHNVTRTNIHADNARLKSYYKRVIKAAILKKPFAKIAREHAKKLVVSPRVKKPRRKTPQTVLL